MKKFATMAISVGLIGAMVAGGSLAYLSDTDSDVNVMTLGSVEIEQQEWKRAEGIAHINAGAKDGDLVPFEDLKTIYPAVPKNGLATDYSAEQTDLFYWGDYVTAEGAGNGLWNDDKLSNVMDKIVMVKNTGKSDAYYRTLIAVECPEGITIGEPAQGAEIMLNVNGNSRFNWEDNLGYIKVDGVRYALLAANYNEVLKPNEISRPSLLQVVMTHHATNEDCALFGESMEILVLSQAVQAQGFADAQTALNAGFGALNTADGMNKALEGFGAAIEEKANGFIAAASDEQAKYNGTTYDSIYEAVAAANANGGGTITLLGSAELDKFVEITTDITIAYGDNTRSVERAVQTRDENYTGTMFTVKAGATLTLQNVVLDGSGATATGNLIATEGTGSIVLNEGTVLQNNNGAHAVSLATRGGGTLTLNGGEIINNSSDSGAIWGGGNITVNSGKINNNASTGIGGAIRMVSNCNLTMNGGEISNNKAAGDGGAIWGYGSSTYNFNGGKMNNNESAGTGGAIYTGTYSVINISGDFELCDNKAANSGAIRLTDHTSMNMTGGTVSGNTQNGDSNAFNTWNNTISITGGTLKDNMSFVGGLGLTIGAADIDGVIAYGLSTNHNTAYLAADFNGFKFTVNEGAANFANFNFKPATGYTYTAGDEAKLVCMNTGYETYWDAATSTFKLQAK